jgi:antagonist of KipI
MRVVNGGRRRVIEVVRPGLLTTVQDLGRWGHQAVGVPVAGPMDLFAHRLANLLVGNPDGAATLEVTLMGPELAFHAASTIAVCGAEFDVTCDGHSIPASTTFWVPTGARLAFGRRRTGARAYLAVAGGIQTPLVLGSRATHLVTAMGGLQGRALAAGDCLPIRAALPPGPARRGPATPAPINGRARLRILPGAQADWFADEAITTLASSTFRVSPRSNRMGYRLDGPPLARKVADEPVSEPLAFGAIQVPTAGEPILLMADRQTAGGYPKIAGVIAADLPLAGQLAPGDTIEFAWCSRHEALAALIAAERRLLRVAPRDASA